MWDGGWAFLIGVLTGGILTFLGLLAMSAAGVDPDEW